MLEEILEHKKKEVAALKKPDYSAKRRDKKGFKESLLARPFIAEVKKASPSLGDINTAADPVEQAKKYEKYGAGAISVLTDEKFFKGSFQFLSEVAESVELPCICKDFIISRVQIDHAYACGASCILLIAAALEKEELKNLSDYARELGLEILFELHELDEYEKIKDLNPEIVGVNSRNLKTLEINKENAAVTLSKVHGDYLLVAESGIETAEDIQKFTDAGAKAFLVGTSLMRAENLEDAFNELYKPLGGLK